MKQIYKIYIDEKVLILAESDPGNLANSQEVETQNFDFQLFYEDIKTKNNAATYLLLTANVGLLFKRIKKSLKLIKAAGGLVSNEENRYLFIYRQGKWDLPKGKLDNGEKTKKAAVREVEEECGIKITKARNKICTTYHLYEMRGKIILKKTTWYWMRADNQKVLTPQLEEGITDARWLAAGDFALVKQNTFPLIRDLIEFIEY